MNTEFDIYFKEEKFTEINPLFVGRQICKSNHNYGPRICQYTIIHYILEGSGTVEQNGVIRKVAKGQMFVIPADTIATYTADKNEPWDYIWIAYDGLLSKNLAFDSNTVLDVNSSVFHELLTRCINGNCDTYFVTSVLYNLHSLFINRADNDESHNYPAQVKSIIQLKYMQSISVEEIARTLNIDKRYMSRIFKQKYQKTIIDYIIDVRMNKACELLRKGYSVADTSALVGYNDSFNFSIMFSKRIGISPREYKNSK